MVMGHELVMTASNDGETLLEGSKLLLFYSLPLIKKKCRFLIVPSACELV